MRWLIGFIITVAVMGFAVFNRQVVEFYYTPFHPPVELPLYMVALGFVVFGFMTGAGMVWLEAIPVRWASRKQRKEIRKLEKKLDEMRQSETGIAPPDDFFPALPAATKASK
jgi:uncharacterized integral membrane protein